MKNSIKNILKEKMIRLKLTKTNLFLKILKSISQNNNITNNIKIYANLNLNRIGSKSNLSTRKHKICLFTGKRSGIVKSFSFSRYTVKKLILANRMTNVKKNNW